MAQTCVAKLLSASLLSHFPLSLSLSLRVCRLFNTGRYTRRRRTFKYAYKIKNNIVSGDMSLFLLLLLLLSNGQDFVYVTAHTNRPESPK